MTDFEVLVKKKLKEKYADDKDLDLATTLASEVFEWSEEGTDAIEEGLKSKVEKTMRDAADDLKELESMLEED
jgi:ribosome maturation protein Sdo1